MQDNLNETPSELEVNLYKQFDMALTQVRNELSVKVDRFLTNEATRLYSALAKGDKKKVQEIRQKAKDIIYTQEELGG